MIELDLERKIADSLNALGIDGLVIFGNLLPVPSGIVAGEEAPTYNIEASVAVQVRSSSEFGWLCPLDFGCSIGITLRADVFPTAAEVAPVMGRVFDMVTGWAREIDGVGPASPLDTETFTPGGIRLDGGSGPRFDLDSCAWRASINFTVRGRIKLNEEVN